MTREATGVLGNSNLVVMCIVPVIVLQHQGCHVWLSWAVHAKGGVCWLQVWRYALEQWFIIGLGVVIGFAAAVPELGATNGYIRAEYSVKLPAIIIIFIISGIGLKTKVGAFKPCLISYDLL